jgi:AAA domain, putative AbiEii toxin, Type IV TA system
MISKVVIRRFKRFKKVTFDLPGHIVFAGPNNTGKTTVLQAIAAWGLAFNRWKQLNDFRRHGLGYKKAPLARQTFSAVPLRAFDLLWNERSYNGPIEVEITTLGGPSIGMEFISDSTEQIYVRPQRSADHDALVRDDVFETIYVPPMTGLSTDEPVYQRPKLDQLLGQGKPGDIIRNLLVEAHQSEQAWPALKESIERLFGYELLPPNASGADIIAEYKTKRSPKPLDVASAGSGFQQVLMLLTFLHTRPASVLLIDEPDAHLHVILQDVIYSELHSVAVRQRSQLIIATHSEVIINSVDPRQLCMLLDKPRPLEDVAERTRLVSALKVLPQTDIMQALETPGVLYLEDYTDLNILREWARILNHPAYETLTTKLFWKKAVWETRDGGPGIKARDHYEALTLVKEDLPGLELLDGDAHPNITDTAITGAGLQRLRWRRYEIESYLLHPDALARYVEAAVGKEAAALHVADLRKYFEDNLPPAVVRDPLGDHAFLNSTKARTDILPPMLAAAGLPGIPYTEYHEIAAVMLPEEIHPEVTEKLDAIQKAFGL